MSTDGATNQLKNTASHRTSKNFLDSSDDSADETDQFKSISINQEQFSSSRGVFNQKEQEPLIFSSKVSPNLEPKKLKRVPSNISDQITERNFKLNKEKTDQNVSNDQGKGIFAQDKSKFIGEINTENYRIMRGYLPGTDSHLRLYYTKLEPFGKKIASLCIVHGFGEHSGRFLDVAEYFVNQGIVVHLLDLRGFGFSGGTRASSSVEELHKDIEVLLRQASPNLPLFLYGHSMGAALIASLLIRNSYLRISGVILTSGLFGFPKERNMPWIKRQAIKLVGGHLEEFMVNACINTTALTHNNHNIQNFLEDKLTSSLIGLKLVKALVELVEFNISHASRFNYPCLIVHGNADIITDYKASVKFYKRISSEHKELKVVEDGMHEIHHDINKEELKIYMLQWLKKRLEKNPRNIGDFNTLRKGLKREDKYTKTLWGFIIIFIYSYLLKYFRGHKLYMTKTKLFWFPIFYFYHVIFKKHNLSLRLK